MTDSPEEEAALEADAKAYHADDWVKLHKEMDITNRLVYWAQNEDMIDQYYTQRGQDLLEAEAEIIKLRLIIDKCIEVCYNMPD